MTPSSPRTDVGARVLPTVSPLLDPAEARRTYYWAETGGPRRPDVHEMYQTIQGLHWTPGEHSDILETDQSQWPDLDPALKQFTGKFLAFFLKGDDYVLDNLAENIVGVVTMPEAKAFYREQEAQEGVHAEAYSLQVFRVLPPEEARALVDGVDTSEAISGLAAWAQAWMSPAAGFWQRMFAFACFEGVVFSSAFAALQTLRDANVLPGIVTYNEFIARDEGVHCDFAILMLNRYIGEARLAQEEVHAILDGAVEGAIRLAAEALRKEPAAGAGAAKKEEYVTLPGGVTFGRLADYVRWVGNRLLLDLGYAPRYRDVRENPLPFMEKMALNRVAKTNFFEHRGTQYQEPPPGAFRWGAVDVSPLKV